MLLFWAKTLGCPVNLSPDGWGVSHQGPGSSGSCVGPLCHPPHRFLADWLPDCLSFTALGFLSAPCSSSLLSSYQPPGVDRVKAVILENRVRRGENVYCVCERERFRVSCPHHSTLEDSGPVTVSNINMSSRAYKNMVKANSLEVCC